MNVTVFLDLENTIIDSLDNCNFIKSNCENITKFVELIFKKKSINPKFRIYSWGFKDVFDIMPFFVKKAMRTIGIPEGTRWSISTKKLSVDKAIERKDIKPEDKDLALEPGGMVKLGLSKVECFNREVEEEFKENPELEWTILIDDLVTERISGKTLNEIFESEFKIAKASKHHVTRIHPEDLHE